MKKRIKFIFISIIVPVVIGAAVCLLLNHVDDTRNKIISDQDQIISIQQSILYDLAKLDAYTEGNSKYYMTSTHHELNEDYDNLKKLYKKYSKDSHDKLVNRTSDSIRDRRDEINNNNQLIQQKQKDILVERLR